MSAMRFRGMHPLYANSPIKHNKNIHSCYLSLYLLLLQWKCKLSVFQLFPLWLISKQVTLYCSKTILFLKIMMISILMILELHATQVCCLAMFTGCNIIKGLDDRLSHEGKATKGHPTVRLYYSHIRHTVSAVYHIPTSMFSTFSKTKCKLKSCLKSLKIISVAVSRVVTIMTFTVY